MPRPRGGVHSETVGLRFSIAGCSRVALVAVALWVANPSRTAHAAGTDAEAVAVEAFDVAAQWCARRALRDTTSALEARAKVAPVLVRVSRAWDEHRLPYLLYWRGVLGACVGESGGPVDLENFLTLTRTQEGSETLRTDAQRRLRRFRRESGGASKGPSPASVVMSIVGGSVLAAGGALVLQAQQEGLGLQSEMVDLAGWTDHHVRYERAQLRQRIGFGVLAGGGGVLVVGVVTIPLGGGR